MTHEEKIISYFNREIKKGDWGEVLNMIQETAGNTLTPKEFDSYLKKSNKDANDCDGMDGIFLNGEYFDWKEFKTKAKDIVKAYLRYFNAKELEKIANALC